MHSVALNGFRLSPQQRRLWLLQERSAVNFCAQAVVRLDGVLDQARLRRAIARSVERHEILRTGFRRLPGVRVPVQVVADATEFEWREVDLRDLAPEERETLAADALAAERQRRFELETDAPLRVALVRLTEDSYVLSLTLPTVCADRLTLRNLFAEIGHIYDAGARSVAGEPGGDAPLQYAQYAEWLHELRTQEEEAQAGREFWDAQLDGAGSTEARFGFERTQETRETFAPASLGVEVAGATWERLAQLAGEHNVTRETLLLACWQTLLWRLNGRAPFAVGFLSEGREHEMLRDAAGILASWLPVPCIVAGRLSLPEVLPRVERTLRDAREWQEFFVLEKCAAAIEAAAGVAETGFLPLAFEYHEAPEPLRASGLVLSPLSEFCLDERFDLKLTCVGGAGGLACELHYNAARFDAVDARRLARQLRALLEEIAARPETPLDEVEIQSSEDLRQLLEEFNRTERDFPRDACLHTLFEQQAARTPDNVAAAFEESRLSFAELNAAANRWAHRLQSLGVGPDVPVGLCAERSVEMMVGLLAILKAGGAYVPLDPRQPTARLSLLLEETGVPVLLTQGELLARLPATAARVLCLDADRASVESESAENPASTVSPGNLAYIIYTSGSTGRPKGVMVQHRSVVNLIAALREAIYKRHAPGDAPLHVSLNAPLVFDASVKQLVQLLEGHALHIIPDAARADAGAL
ncbi:MAG: condensation domain-containing protein, partial [Pyrinomonadaceae bacterium]